MLYKLKRTAGIVMLMSMLIPSLAACGNSATPTTSTGGTTAETPTTGGGVMTGTISTGEMSTATTGTGVMTGTATSGEMMGTATTNASGGMTPTMSGVMTGTSTSGVMTGTTTTGGATGGFTSGGPITLPGNCANTSISYWTPLSGPDGQAMTALTDSFNKENPNVKVNITTGSFTDYNTQLGTAAASNTLPDIAIINEDQVATQAFRNVIRPIPDAAMSGIGVTAADYPAVAWGAGTVAGKQYAIPLSFVAMTMYYNEDMLKAAGISAPPTDKASFEAAAKAMTANGKNGFLLTTGFPVQQIFQTLLHQYGGTEFNSDGSKATWNSDAGVQALTWMQQASANYGQKNLEVDADLNAFKAGTVGMIWNGIWQLSSVTGSAVSFTGKAAPVPQIGTQPAVWAGGPLLTFTYTKNPDACKDTVGAMFYKYLIDHSVDWAKGGNIPANNKARASAAFQALPQANIGPSVANPVFPPAIPGIGDAFAPLGTQVGAVIAGTQTDIKKALDTAADQANTILTQNKTNYGSAPKQP
ncbi:MAG: ABC transporter substrate-binding protein [Chloroflexi bacterium]|nr:ABC transporter substrate-binding protein [Chloroflexota bacterium]